MDRLYNSIFLVKPTTPILKIKKGGKKIENILKILLTATIFFLAAFYILGIVAVQLGSNNLNNLLVMIVIALAVSFQSPGLIPFSLLYPMLYMFSMDNQQNTLVSVLIVLIIGFLITFVSLRYYRSSSIYKRRKSVVAVKGTHKLFPAPKQLNCLYCGSEIPENAEFCPNCDAARAMCSVCNQAIVSEDPFIMCPLWLRASQLDHLLDWVKVKGYCPNCRHKLKKREIA